jgi:hypothetical protein
MLCSSPSEETSHVLHVAVLAQSHFTQTAGKRADNLGRNACAPTYMPLAPRCVGLADLSVMLHKESTHTIAPLPLGVVRTFCSAATGPLYNRFHFPVPTIRPVAVCQHAGNASPGPPPQMQLQAHSGASHMHLHLKLQLRRCACWHAAYIADLSSKKTLILTRYFNYLF